MALSSILQFDCSIDNEIAQNAMKNFAGFLGKAFEENKKLWNEYLKLRKYCEDADFNIPFQVLESDIYNNKNVIAPDISQVSSENTHTFTSSQNSISPSYNPDITDLDNIILTNKSINKKAQEDILLKSPILIKKRSRCKRTNQDILFQKLKKSKCPIKKNYYEETECTSVTEMAKRLKVSTSHNINNILVQNNNKQPQAMSLLDKQLTDSTTHKKYKDSDFLKPRISNIFKENIEVRLKNSNRRSIEEEIIECSPSEHITSCLNRKNIKRKNKTSNKDSKETNQINLDMFMPVHTSTQKDQSLLVTGLDIHNFLPLVNTEDNRNVSTSRNEVKKIELQEDTNLTFNDETFCLFGEKLKEMSAHDTNEIEIIEHNISENKMSPKLSSIKKSLINSFDVPSSKKKSEKTKVTGTSCWQCKRKVVLLCQSWTY